MEQTFTNIRKTPTGDVSVGLSPEYVIKIEHKKHPWKLRTFAEEIETIKWLNSRGCISCPRLANEGILKTGERYFIQERFHSRRDFNVADMLFSIIEQKSFGVCQGDFKKENFVFDNDSVCHIIDYDQAIYGERLVDMDNLKYLEWFNQFFVKRWKGFGFDFADIYSFGKFSKKEVFNLFKNGSFNLAETSLFKEQVTTRTESGIYQSLETNKIYIEGARDLKPRLAALNNIDFKTGEKILDVGCNMGLLSHYLYDRGCEATGVDMDEKIITGARMVANILNKRVRFKCLDLNIAEIEEDYDTICLFSVLQHIANFRQAVKNIAQKCERILLESSPREYGLTPVGTEWEKASSWNFENLQGLINGIEKIFKGFKFQKIHGDSDRNRKVMSFVR